jgi:hypothetical protein
MWRAEILPTGHFSAPQTVRFIALFICRRETCTGSGQPPVESEWAFWAMLDSILYIELVTLSADLKSYCGPLM